MQFQRPLQSLEEVWQDMYHANSKVYDTTDDCGCLPSPSPCNNYNVVVCRSYNMSSISRVCLYIALSQDLILRTVAKLYANSASTRRLLAKNGKILRERQATLEGQH